MNEKEKKVEEKKLRCPFSIEDLDCKNCRLYQPYIGGKGARLCVFLNMKEV
ncbi:hypothetical protein ES702_06732 [subsurface metagenome]